MGLDPRLCTHDELPSWAKDNAFIVTGYRRPGGSDAGEGGQDNSDDDAEIISLPAHEVRTGEKDGDMRQRSKKSSKNEAGANKADDALTRARVFRHDTIAKCWTSVWGYGHNESINIHTHMWGALTAVVILGIHAMALVDAVPASLHTLTHAAIFRSRAPASSLLRHRRIDWLDIAGFATFLLCAVACLGLSSTFHTLSCHSKSVARRCNALDYLGIVFMIVGSFLPALHYGFFCRPHWQLFYGIGITALGAMAAWVVLSPHYSTPEFRPYRTAIFLALGLSAVIPVAHGTLIQGYSSLRDTMGLDFLITSGSLYVVGALLYALRIPERFAPGTFDYVGASHQIFHVCILLAAFSHYISLRKAFDFSQSLTC